MLSAASGKGHIVSWQRAGFTRLMNYTNTCQAIKVELIKAIISSLKGLVNIEKNRAMLTHKFLERILRATASLFATWHPLFRFMKNTVFKFDVGEAGGCSFYGLCHLYL